MGYASSSLQGVKHACPLSCLPMPIVSRTNGMGCTQVSRTSDTIYYSRSLARAWGPSRRHVRMREEGVYAYLAVDMEWCVLGLGLEVVVYGT